MQMDLVISAAAWALVVMTVAALAVYRKTVSRGEFDVVHIKDAESALIPEQESLARRLDVIDRWGKRLTVVAVLFGLAILAIYLVRAWDLSNQLAR